MRRRRSAPDPPLGHGRQGNGTLSPVGRIRLIASLAGVVGLLALVVPGVAYAGTYTWSQPGDFSGTQGALKYGAPSWTYEVDGAAFSAFSAGTWSDGLGDSIGTASGSITMSASAGHSVSLVWTNPTGQTATVTSSFNASGLLCVAPTGPVGGTVPAGQPATFTLTGAPLNPCSASGTITITATTPSPTVTLTSPSNGAALTDAEPTFTGSASSGFGIPNQVKVHVYSGSSASGTAVETLTATVSNGAYSVEPNPDLSSGTYTAQTEQDDLGGGRGLSAPVTFTVSVSPPAVTLDSLGNSPLQTASPTFTGTGGTASDDSKSILIAIFRGPNTTSTAVRFLSGSIGSDGHYSVQTTPDLPDGQYTAVTAQAGGGGAGYSKAVTFSIKLHPPALTLDHPAAGASVGRGSLAFSGHAGDVYGDSPTITVYLYRGSRATGPALGKLRVRVSGPIWSATWPTQLTLGLYTARAVQTDDAGHTTRTGAHIFRLTTGPRVVSSKVTMSRSGSVAVSVACLAPAGQTCAGTVLVITQHAFQATQGGPTGQLELLYSYVKISGGTARTIRGSAQSAVARTLSRVAGVALTVAVKLSKSGGGAINETVGRTLTIT